MRLAGDVEHREERSSGPHSRKVYADASREAEHNKAVDAAHYARNGYLAEYHQRRGLHHRERVERIADDSDNHHHDNMVSAWQLAAAQTVQALEQSHSKYRQYRRIQRYGPHQV